MYYFFNTKLIYWRDEVIQAILTNQVPHEIEREWLYGKHMPASHEFTFSIRDDAPILDNYWTGSLFSLYSERLISIFYDAHINFDLFPSDFVSKRTGKNLNFKHKVFRLLEINACLDESKSTYKMLPIGKQPKKVLTQPVFTETFLKSNKMLTRIAGNEKLVIIHSDLKKILEEEKITGCDFQSNQLDETNLFEKG